MAEGATTLKGLRAQMGKGITAWHFIFYARLCHENAVIAS